MSPRSYNPLYLEKRFRRLVEFASFVRPSPEVHKTLRDQVHAYIGPTNRLGIRNGKTATLGTYRPVGTTCPDSCPYLNSGCLAQRSKVGMHQSKSSPEVDRALASAAVGILYAMVTRDPWRELVSGDAGKTWEDAREYHEGLILMLSIAKEHPNAPRWFGWRYTHLPRTPEGLGIVGRLKSLGLFTRWSDYAGPGGALVKPHDDQTIKALKAQGLKPFRCLEQTTEHENCMSCRACWERPSHTIIFKAQGNAYTKPTKERPWTIYDLAPVEVKA